jgi:glycyl-tRNA synthetase beta subunit
MAKPVAFIEQTIIFDPSETFAHLYQFEAKFSEFLKINGLEAEVMEPYGNTTRRVLFIRKIEEVEAVEPPPQPEIKGPQQAIKDLKKGLK